MGRRWQATLGEGLLQGIGGSWWRLRRLRWRRWRRWPRVGDVALALPGKKIAGECVDGSGGRDVGFQARRIDSIVEN